MKRTYRSRPPVNRASPAKKPAALTRREKRHLRQLTLSAFLLVLAVALKLLAPEQLAAGRETLRRWMGQEVDFAAVFADMGRAVSRQGGLGDAINDAYIAVFGIAEPSESSEASDTPADAVLTQEILHFAYAPPVEGTPGSPFGWRDHPIYGDHRFHYGLDFEAETGTVIRAFAAGTVSAVGESSELGKYVTVVHEGGYETLYAHCDRVTASAGQQVQLGDPIAQVGETGLATGPHLHFELHRDIYYLDPIYYVA